MAEQTAPSLMYQIGAHKQELETRSNIILGVRRTAFQEMSLLTPRLSHPELAFHQAVTWLYGFYYEAGSVSVRFLIGLSSAYGLDQGGKHRQHYDGVRRLRTYLQHNLNLDSRHDIETQLRCQDWFSEVCGSAFPGNCKEWEECLVRILTESEGFLTAAIECIRAIERDDSSSNIVAQWSFRLSRYHPKHEFEELVAIVIHDMGQDSLDCSRLTARYYEKWNKDLSYRSESYIFEEEARKLIEQTLLNETEVPLPISGKDVIRELGISSGTEVWQSLRKAKALYFQEPCGKEQLLSRLRDVVNSG